MITVPEIRELKEYYVNDLYSTVRKEQKTDDEFYKDTFAVPQIQDPNKLQRTGRASRLIDSPTENVITSNPQALVLAISDTKGATDRAFKMSSEFNKWLGIMKRTNPNTFKEFVKNCLLRGEGWVQLLHNEKWVTGSKIRKGLPVLFEIPDPMIIYADPVEDENGIPEQVIISYEVSPRLIKARFTKWTNPKGAGQGRNAPLYCKYLEYWNKDNYYIEADEEPILDDGFNDNLYGFVPFIHKLSGFGKKSPEGKMEDLIVGRLKKSRSLLIRECAIVSDIDSAIHLFSNRSLDVQPTDDMHSVPDNFSDNYVMGAGQLHEIPAGIKVVRSEELLPEPQIFQHLHDISSQLEREDPMVMSGMPVGESGRLQDMVNSSAMKRYLTIVENTEYAFATGIELALKICKRIPTLTPDGIKDEDIEEPYNITVKLKADDPLENDRKAMAGSRFLAASEIDPMTNLIDFKGYSQEKAKQILEDMLMWKVLLNNPEIASLIGMRAAEKSGMAEDLQVIRQRRMQLEQQQTALNPGMTPNQMQRSVGEVQSPSGVEQIDMALSARGARKPPTNYTRSG